MIKLREEKEKIKSKFTFDTFISLVLIIHILCSIRMFNLYATFGWLSAYCFYRAIIKLEVLNRKLMEKK